MMPIHSSCLRMHSSGYAREFGTFNRAVAVHSMGATWAREAA